MRTTLAIGFMLGSLALAGAQSAPSGSGKLPEGWNARLDDPAAALNHVIVQQKENAVTFTTGPAGIYYKSAMHASGDYELSAVVSQIKTTARPEEYGLFIAGSDLDKDTRHYTSFLVRQDGRYQIATRDGADVKPLVDWTDAPPMHEPSGMKTSNTLLIRVTGDDVRFFIDGRQVHELTRTGVGRDGVVGVRVGEDLDVQVTKLTLKKR